MEEVGPRFLGLASNAPLLPQELAEVRVESSQLVGRGVNDSWLRRDRERLITMTAWWQEHEKL